jgi:cholest-4-en-3-one 26-monooxygenase
VTSAFHFDDPDQYVRGTPYHQLAWLRRESPLSWQRRSTDPHDGFWLVTRHEDVVAISRNPGLFGTHAPLLQDPLPRELWRDFPAGAMIADNLLTYEPRKHGCFRIPINAMVAPARIAALESEIRAACVTLMRRNFARPRFDFPADIALPFPTFVVLGLVLGIPACDHEGLSRAILAINAMDDPTFSPRPGGMFRGAEELLAYGKRHAARLMEAARTSILGELVATRQIDGLSKEETFLAYWFPLTAGAFDTTAATIAGGVRALLQYPEQADRLRATPALIPSAVEEMIRWVSPVIYFRRTAVSDTTLRGQPVAKGQKVILCYAAANRDEAVFAEPDQFDIGRHPNPHVSFGYGPHFCLGAALARTMIRVFLEELGPYLDRLQLDGDVVHTRSSWMNRICSMPVRVRQ